MRYSDAAHAAAEHGLTVVEASPSFDGSKLVEIRLENGQVQVAGTFCRRFGPLNARIECAHDGDCGCGFIAHTNITGALRYSPGRPHRLDQHPRPPAATLQRETRR